MNVALVLYIPANHETNMVRKSWNGKYTGREALILLIIALFDNDNVSWDVLEYWCFNDVLGLREK